MWYKHVQLLCKVCCFTTRIFLVLLLHRIQKKPASDVSASKMQRKRIRLDVKLQVFGWLEAHSIILLWVLLETFTVRTIIKKMHTSETSAINFYKIPQKRHHRNHANHGLHR